MHLRVLDENWFETFYIFKYDFFWEIFFLILLKFYYFVLDAKLLINHVEFFFFLYRKSIDKKKLTKIFIAIDVTIDNGK